MLTIENRRSLQEIFWPLAIFFVLVISSCGETGSRVDNGVDGTIGNNVNPSLSRDEILKNRAGQVLASIPGEGTLSPDNLITAAQLKEKLDDPDQAEQLFLLDTRPRNEWEEQGHIEGAHWVKMQDAADPQNLDKLPRDKLIVCISPTGHTAVQVATTLRWLGFNAAALEFGMSAWTAVPARQIIIDDVKNGMANKYPTSSQPPSPNTPAPEKQKIELSPPADDQFEILAQTATGMLKENVFQKEYPFNHIFADSLNQRLLDPDLKQQTFLLDIRPLAQSFTHVDATHDHIDWRLLGEPENLVLLPRDKLIVVIGATGQTAGQVTPILRMLGFNAVTLRSGVTAWTETEDSQRTLQAVGGSDYPVTSQE